MADRNLHEKLVALGYKPEQGMAIRKLVSVSEKGKVYKLQITGSRESYFGKSKDKVFEEL